MQTPWGDIAVHDAHAHLFSYSFFEALGRQKGAGDIAGMVESLGWQVPPRDNAELARRWVTEFDRRGVAGSVLMASAPGDEAAAGDAVRVAPDRIYGYFMLDPSPPAPSSAPGAPSKRSACKDSACFRRCTGFRYGIRA